MTISALPFQSTFASHTTQTTTSTSTNTEKEEIWSSILSSVASSKMVSAKKLLILGDPKCGKSTLIHYLKNDPGPRVFNNENGEEEVNQDGIHHASTSVSVAADGGGSANNHFGIASSYGVNGGLHNDDNTDEATHTLALGYTYMDVQDEENEAIARLGVYQLGLSASEYRPLLKFALCPETLSDSAVIIVLDWTRPWTFLETLERWIDVLECRLNEICKGGSNEHTTRSNWSKGKVIVDELRERLQHYLQTYTEPLTATTFNSTSANANSNSTGSDANDPSEDDTAYTNTNSKAAATNTSFVPSPLVITTTAVEQVTLPLTQGMLTNNLGVPIIIVCCKSDAQNTLEQTLDYKEEHFDFIQQTLRCICMKYGAALFYTSTLQPYTFHNLRQYILHRLLSTPNKPYPFKLKAQVVERDVIIVPAGWDSWGKIRILIEAFDCEAVNEGWDSDMDAVVDRQQPLRGARSNYEEIIENPNATDQPLNNISPPVTCEDEQAFLERHFETLQQYGSDYLPKRKGTGATPTQRPGIVGPISTASSVNDLFMRSASGVTEDRLTGASNNNATASALNRLATSSMAAGASILGGNGNVGSSGSNASKLLSSVANASAIGGGGVSDNAGGVGGLSSIHQAGNAGPSHEVLANFFQSLLVKKASGGAGSSSSNGANTTVTNSSNALSGNSLPGGDDTVSNSILLSGTAEIPSRPTARRPTVSRKDVHKELDRMRQYVNNS
ncbi:dynein light intermediate chain-domain-containing protein [Mycotypha africana]|uniref:dynein light intermediate chain-domain-containing protein n=1 Tax=Mycotypha africana TaxID=64632 RepID=UPI00230076C4|nr:dynein light intermediate chain-domain-containing protein [Mycotypha africana]KAI8979073.1 dynein light intermediate chain-domain-containing protein [Mycotypha africana]